MRRFKRRGTAYSRIDELSPEHFGLRKTARHGFPDSPSAIGFDNETNFLVLGTKNGEFRIHGQPGVEFRAETPKKSEITQIFTFGSLHQYITVHNDNSILLWQLEEQAGSHSLKIINEFQMEQDGGKKITTCCLSQLTGHLYIGTDGGNVYTLDVRLFELMDNDAVLWEKATALLFELMDNDAVLWEKATALIQGTNKTHPGSVVSIVLCPTNYNKVLIGYECGIITLWDLKSSFPERNYPNSVENCQQPLESLAWQNEGQKFVSAHSDSSIYFWNSSVSTPEQGPIKHYGETCSPIKQISWLNSDSNPVLIFSGGLPDEDTDDHNSVTVLQGTEHVALDFTSDIIAFVPISDQSTKRGKAVIILCEQEIMAFDLEAPKCPQIFKPYLYSLHVSPVTCVRIYDNSPKDLLTDLQELTLTSPQPNEYTSNSNWPVTGGKVRISDPPTLDILVTGHANGSIKFWDVTSPAMVLLLDLKTGPIFSNPDSNEGDLDMFSEFTWPPYRKVSSFDPFDDDTRLSIKFIEFCPHSRKLCVGGEGGQVLTFALNTMPADVRVANVRAEIFIDDSRSKRGGVRSLKNSSPLSCKSDFISFPAGFQPSFCVQCLPASPITAMAFRPSWGLVSAANTKGFMVANFYTKSIVIIHPTVLSDGIEARNISKTQSFRRSVRSSVRRRASVVAANEERKKIAASLNLELGISEPKTSRQLNRRTNSADASVFLDSTGPVVGKGVTPEQRGHVSHLLFAETHISSGGPHVSVLASTMGSTIIRYSIEVPKAAKIYTDANRAHSAGKDYSLVHAAPIISVFILDRDGQLLPSPNEVEHHAIPVPNMAPPHFAVIVTQEQIKVISLPNMRSKRKEKIHSLIHERIYRAWIIKVKVPAAPVGAPRDWNNALVILTAIGHLLIYSLPDLRLSFHKELFVNPSDQNAMKSLTISQSGETFHLCSFSELERRLLCAYNFSYHTSLLPTIHTSTVPLPVSRESSKKKLVTDSDTSSPRLVGQDNKENISSSFQRLTSPALSSLTSEHSVRNSSKSPSTADIDAEKKKKSSPLRNSVEFHQTDKTDGIVQIEPPTETEVSLSPEDKKVLASASAFTQAINKTRSPSQSSSSSSSDSESDSDSEDDGDEEKGATFGNPLALGDIGLDSSKELDTIIASSLQQLESARAFYAHMQGKARGNPNQ